jgi:hypothetical protein
VSNTESCTDETSVSVPMPLDLLTKLDAWIAGQPKPVSRPKAIRGIVAAGLQILAVAEVIE